MSLKVLHITPSFYPATYFGGPIFSTLGLCDALAQLENIGLRVLTTDTAGPAKEDRVVRAGFPVRFPAGYDVYYCRKWFGRDMSPEMFRHLVSMVCWADVVHLTGVYSPPTIPALLVCRLFNRPVVWSPRGSLQRWEGSTRPFAKRVWEFLCNVLLRRGRSVLHVTSEVEAAASKARMPKAEIEIIPNGVDLPPLNPNRVWQPKGHLRLLYLGRLDPKKAIENLLEAIALIQADSVTLSICGEGQTNYVQTLKQKMAALNLTERVVFKGHVSGSVKTDAFENADICILPSYSENFGMVVVESLAHGVPVIVSKGTPWQAVETHGCGIWIENTPAALSGSIRVMSTRDLAAMGANGRAWVESEFNWNGVAYKMLEAYKKLLKGD